MNEKELQQRYEMLFDLQDVLNLSIEEIGIFNSIILDRVQWSCSLEDSDTELQLNAKSLVRDQPRLNLMAIKIFDNVDRLSKICDILSAIVDDLNSGVATPRCIRLCNEVLQ